jgi:kynurenine formamidase
VDSSWRGALSARVIDLAHPLHRGMPVSPNHPAFQLALMRRHGDMMRPDGGSAANEIIVTGGHVGTHIDALAHVSQDGLLHGGIDPDSIQSNHGFSNLGIDSVEPIVCRGLLLDIAALHGVDVLDAGYEISVDDLEESVRRAGVTIMADDAILIRTGWARHWTNPEMFVGAQHGTPGPGEAAAAWLANHEIRLVGAETIAFEVIAPGRGHAVLPAHRTLLVEAGIHIIEVMDLSRIGEAGVSEFLFVATPLKLVGATGSPIRPIALIDG